MALIADHRFYADSNYGGSSVKTVQQLVIETQQFANTVYSQTNINGHVVSLAIAKIVIYTSQNSVGNPFAVDVTTAGAFLSQLMTGCYNDVCLAHGFTAITFDGGILGLANVGTTCRLC